MLSRKLYLQTSSFLNLTFKKGTSFAEKNIRKKFPFAQNRPAMKLKIAVTVILIW